MRHQTDNRCRWSPGLGALVALIGSCTSADTVDPAKVGSPVLWAGNSSQEYHSAPDQREDWGAAVGILTSRDKIERNIYDQTCDPSETEQSQDCTAEVTASPNHLCAGQGPGSTDWSQQSTLEKACTVTMIRQNLFLTAAHCILEDGYADGIEADDFKPPLSPEDLAAYKERKRALECSNRTVNMRWRTNPDSTDANPFVLHQHLYDCVEVVRGLPNIASPSGKFDWAVFRVDREVTGGAPTGGPVTPEVRESLFVDVRPTQLGPMLNGTFPSSGACSQGSIDCPFLISHIKGLPLKYESDVIVRYVDFTGEPGTFHVEGDVDGGSSGGALLSPEGRILGVVHEGTKNPRVGSSCKENQQDEDAEADKNEGEEDWSDCCEVICHGESRPDDFLTACPHASSDTSPGEQETARRKAMTVFSQAKNVDRAFRSAIGNYDGDNLEDAAALNVRNGMMVIDVQLGNGTRYDIATDLPDVGLSDETYLFHSNGEPFDRVVVILEGKLHYIPGTPTGLQTLFEVAETQDKQLTAINPADFNEDGLDDIEVAAIDPASDSDDEAVAVFFGENSGFSAAIPQSGLPSARTDDGRMVLLSGTGLDTVAANEAHLKITIGSDNTAALDNFTVEVFDGDNGGLHQFDREVHTVKTCYRLTTDPCGDGGLGNCLSTPRATEVVIETDNTAFQDNVWGILFSGAHSDAASLLGDGEAPFTYDLHVYFSGDCSVRPQDESKVAFAIGDALKVRSNGLVSHPSGMITFIGSDSEGDFGAGLQPYLTNTAYDGIFRIPFAVGAAATEIQLTDLDADASNDASDPGVSDGATPNIQYQLFKPDGSVASLVGAEDSTATSLVDNPSGNNDGYLADDVETRIHEIVGSGAGRWVWEWRNIGAGNAVHVMAPFGSPTTHEILGASWKLTKLSTAWNASRWYEETADLDQQLPLVIGEKTDTGLAGRSQNIDSVAAAQSILTNGAGSLRGELEKQLLTLTLNRKRSASLGQVLDSGLVYGTTTPVRLVFNEANAAVADGVRPVDAVSEQRLVELLSAINEGEVNFRHPDMPFPAAPTADDDGDGIINVKDNCPALANVDQADGDGDRTGDACAVKPAAACVVRRNDMHYDAFVSYESPAPFHSIPLGSRNHVQGALSGEPPTQFLSGVQPAFVARFDRDGAVSWTIEGQTLTVDANAATCSGVELFEQRDMKDVVLFGAESLSVGRNVLVSASPGRAATLQSNGVVEVGEFADVGRVIAGLDLHVATGSVIRGELVAGRMVALDDHVRRFGALRQGSYVAPRDIGWVYPTEAARREIIVAAGQRIELSAGSYGNVVVKAGGELVLGPGPFEFSSLTVAKRGELAFAAADVGVKVITTLELLGTVARLPDAARGVIAFFGSSEVRIEGAFSSKLLAPNATVTLGGEQATSVIGAVFAQRLNVAPDVRVVAD